MPTDYICPAGKTLTTTGRLVNDGKTFFICRNCPLKAQCWPKAPFRRVPRSIYEEARDIARKISLSRNRSLRARENAE